MTKTEFWKQQEKMTHQKQKSPHYSTSVFLNRILKARREWDGNIPTTGEKNYQPRILYLEKLSFWCKREIKTSSNKQNWDSSLPQELPHKKG